MILIKITNKKYDFLQTMSCIVDLNATHEKKAAGGPKIK